MRTLRRLSKALLVGGLSAVLLGGVMSLAAPRAAAALPYAPILLCGPTIRWSCSGVGGPDVLFVGTVCQKARFEHRTNKTCVPLGG